MKSLVATFLLSLSLQAYSQTTDEAVRAYLCSQSANFEVTAQLDKLLDKNFYQAQYYFFGENHGSALPQQIDIELFRRLHKNAGVRHYIAEVDATKAWMLNRYLQDADTTWLYKVFASWKQDTAQWANREHLNKWKSLQAFQAGLSPKDRFQVVGIDVPQDYTLVYDYAAAITKGKNNIALQRDIDSLLQISKGLQYEQRSLLNSFARRLLQRMDQQQAIWQRGFKKDYAAFRHLVTSLGWIGAGLTRDSFMYRSLTDQVAANRWEEKKMYGFLGYFHCLQTGYNGTETAVSLLKKHQAANIISLQMQAVRSKVMLPYIAPINQMMPRAAAEKILLQYPQFPKGLRYIPFDLSNDGQMMFIKGIGLLDSCAGTNKITLFRLNGPNSPFTHTQLLAEITGFQTLKLNDRSSTTLQAFQYVILFNGSPSATPLPWGIRMVPFLP